jgi:hypothetical protein
LTTFSTGGNEGLLDEATADLYALFADCDVVQAQRGRRRRGDRRPKHKKKKTKSEERRRTSRKSKSR